MTMGKALAAKDPDAYVGALDGWRRDCVEHLRAAARGAAKLDEVIKWGHLVYLGDGPVLSIRAEDRRVLCRIRGGIRAGREATLSRGGMGVASTSPRGRPMLRASHGGDACLSVSS